MNKNWAIEVDGEIRQIDRDTLKQWLRSGKIGPAKRVRRDSLR